MEEYMQLNKDNTFKLKIKNQFGEDTGKFLKFDLEDIELPLRYEEMFKRHNQNESYVKRQFIIIDKTPDKPGEILTANEKSKLKIMKEFYKREMEALDLFLGEGSTQMILDIMGRKPYLGMFDDIGKALAPVKKVFEENAKITENYIKDTYNIDVENVIE